MKTKIFISGSSGFIGFHVAKKYLDKGFKVHGIDSMNNYYDVNLKKSRLKVLKRYKNSISNKRLNINLYYKFSNKIPASFIWHSMDKDKEFIPSFTKKIFRQVSILF